jgi:folate-binding protein YgfZ
MNLLDDYRAIRHDAAVAEPMARGLIGVSGRDRASYLQGLLTNDVQALTPGSGCYAVWLTPQGRMTTDMHVLESGDMMLLDVPASLASSVLERLEAFVFTEDVRLADLSATLTGIGLHGPRAASILARTLPDAVGLDQWPPYHNARFAFADTGVVVSRIDQLGVPGFVIYADVAHANAVRAALVAHGARQAGPRAVAAARIEAGYPLFGEDMTDDIIPLEAGIESRAISFSKGCYVGQEVVIRVLHRGHGRVVRKLVGLRIQGPEAAAPGTKLHAAEREVGFITSSAVSPETGSIALAYVHRDFIEPGAHLEAAVEQGVRRAATVSSLPFQPAA